MQKRKCSLTVGRPLVFYDRFLSLFRNIGKLFSLLSTHKTTTSTENTRFQKYKIMDVINNCLLVQMLGKRASISLSLETPMRASLIQRCDDASLALQWCCSVRGLTLRFLPSFLSSSLFFSRRESCVARHCQKFLLFFSNFIYPRLTSLVAVLFYMQW